MTDRPRLVLLAKASRTTQRQRNEADARNAKRGAAGVAVTGGLVAGGIPGARSKYVSMATLKDRTVDDSTRMRNWAAAGRGGIFGFRQAAHKHEIKANITPHIRAYAEKVKSGAPMDASDHMWEGIHQGRLKSEKRILNTLNRGKKLGAASVLGGSGYLAREAYRARSEAASKSLVEVAKEAQPRKRRLSESGSYGLVGAGAATAGGGLGVANLLERASRKEIARGKHHFEEGHKLVPEMGGWDYHPPKKPKDVPSIREHQRLSDTGFGAKHWGGHYREDTLRAAGEHRGKAVQHAYFGHEFKRNAKAIRRYSPLLGGGLAAAGIANAEYRRRTG